VEEKIVKRTPHRIILNIDECFKQGAKVVDLIYDGKIVATVHPPEW